MPNKFRKLPSLNTLIVFEAAFRLQSFTRAADEVALSPASVSRRIRELEENLNVQLFDRKRYGVMPTPAGEMFAATVRLSLNELLAAANLARNRNVASNRLTIFSDISLANALITPVLGEFHRHYPEIKLHVLSSSEPIEFISEEFDVGLQYGRRAEAQYVIEPISDEIIFPVCSPQMAEKLPTNCGQDEIARQPLLHFCDSQRTWTTWQDFLEPSRLREPDFWEELRFSSYQVSLDVAEKGEGIALGWRLSVKPKIDDGKLVRISELTRSESIYAYRKNLGEPNPIVDQFIQLLRTYSDSEN